MRTDAVEALRGVRVSRVDDLLTGPWGTTAVALVILVLGVVWTAWVRLHRGAAALTDAHPGPRSASAAADSSATEVPGAGARSRGGRRVDPSSADRAPAVVGEQSGATTTDVLARPEQTAPDPTHDAIVDYVGERSLLPRRRRPARTDLDESSQVFWFFVVPLVAAAAAAVLVPVFYDEVTTVLRGVLIAAVLLVVVAMLAGRRLFRILPLLWWAALVVVAAAVGLWCCHLLAHGAYGHQVMRLRRAADGRTMTDAYRIMLHRYGAEGALALVVKALGAGAVAATGCYVTVRAFGVLAAVEAAQRANPGSWHRDLVERVYPRGGPRNATLLVVLGSLLALGLCSGQVAAWIHQDVRDAHSSSRSSPAHNRCLVIPTGVPTGESPWAPTVC